MVTKLDITKIKQFLGRADEQNLELKDVVRLAELMTDSMLKLLEGSDEYTHDGLSKISQQIIDMKQELTEFRAEIMGDDHFPEAGRELDAVVEATESATNTIMEAAEAIMGGDPSDPDAYHAMVNDKVIEIFEACSFQDITGQRISKVVKTLNLIEEQVTSMITTLDDQQQTKEQTKKAINEDKLVDNLLNGPSFEGEGVQQDDVDKYFN